MTNIADPLAIVRECKGAALAILWLLLATKQPQTQEWLERRSGYTDKPVSQALAYLEETQRVIHGSEGWSIQEGVQLYLPIGSEDEKDENYPTLSRNNSDSPIITTIDSSQIIDQEVAEETGIGGISTDYPMQSRNNSDSADNEDEKDENYPTLSRNNSDSPLINLINNNIDLKEKERSLLINESRKYSDSEVALGKLGIAINPTTKQLLELTPEEIRAGRQRALQAGHPEIGYLIRTLQNALITKKSKLSRSYDDWLT